jgi:hypothetical protein
VRARDRALIKARHVPARANEPCQSCLRVAERSPLRSFDPLVGLSWKFEFARRSLAGASTGSPGRRCSGSRWSARWPTRLEAARALASPELAPRTCIALYYLCTLRNICAHSMSDLPGHLIGAQPRDPQRAACADRFSGNRSLSGVTLHGSSSRLECARPSMHPSRTRRRSPGLSAHAARHSAPRDAAGVTSRCRSGRRRPRGPPAARSRTLWLRGCARALPRPWRREP